jgi:outer membrane receptor protein involved in Fe transport
LSQIPLAMVERVEILRDGASTVYGSDAITGVVNVILRDDFEGLNLSMTGGISTHGDAESTSVSATMGGNFARGNVVASLEYRTFDNVRATDRDWVTPSINSVSRTGYGNGSTFSPGGWFSTAGWPIFCTRPETFFGGDSVTNTFTNTGLLAVVLVACCHGLVSGMVVLVTAAVLQVFRLLVRLAMAVTTSLVTTTQCVRTS